MKIGIDEIIENLRRSGVRVEIVAWEAGAIVAEFSWRRDKIFLSRFHYSGGDPEYDTDRIVSILFHEAGHRKRFLSLPDLTPEQRGTLENHKLAEEFAFQHQLRESLKLFRERKIPGPLESSLYWLKRRRDSGEEDAAHQYGLDCVVDSDLWTRCELALRHSG